jgi:hypothetical protein
LSVSTYIKCIDQHVKAATSSHSPTFIPFDHFRKGGAILANAAFGFNSRCDRLRPGNSSHSIYSRRDRICAKSVQTRSTNSTQTLSKLGIVSRWFRKNKFQASVHNFTNHIQTLLLLPSTAVLLCHCDVIFR